LTTPLRVVAGLFLASLAMRPQILAIGPLLRRSAPIWCCPPASQAC